MRWLIRWLVSIQQLPTHTFSKVCVGSCWMLMSHLICSFTWNLDKFAFRCSFSFVADSLRSFKSVRIWQITYICATCNRYYIIPELGGKNECVNEACCRNFPRGSEKDINSHTTNPIQFPWRAPDSTLKEILVLLVTNSLPPWRERHQDGTRAGLKRDLGVSRINETLIHASNELNWKVKTSKHQSFIS